MKTRIIAAALAAVVLIFTAASCAQKTAALQDGYFTAEAQDFDSHGWKEFVTIYVRNNNIVTVEYNAMNASGFVKSWDLNYMRNMSNVAGTYPNQFARTYAVSLINWQDPARVDAISGATESHGTFRLLAEAAINQARTGDKHVALVDVAHEGNG